MGIILHQLIYIIYTYLVYWIPYIHMLMMVYLKAQVHNMFVIIELFLKVTYM